jgi:hypothetical protein
MHYEVCFKKNTVIDSFTVPMGQIYISKIKLIDTVRFSGTCKLCLPFQQRSHVRKGNKISNFWP